MNNDLLMSAFDDCINRLADGETVEDCLSRYPNLRDDLQPLLETGLLVGRVRYNATTVAAAQVRIERRLFDLLGPAALSTSVIVGIAIAALLLGGVIGAVVMGIFTSTEPPAPTANPVIIVTATQAQPTASNTPILPTPTALPTDTPIIPTATWTNTPVPTATAIPPSPTGNTSNDVVLVIEGPVSAIDVNVVTIFNQTITLAPDAPVLAVIQLGDVLRVEGVQSDTSIRAINVIFINVEVIINDDGQVWRDSLACDNPPPQWVLDTDGGATWIIRCTGNNSGGSPSGSDSPSDSNGSSGGDDNDNDDGDDDDD